MVPIEEYTPEECRLCVVVVVVALCRSAARASAAALAASKRFAVEVLLLKLERREPAGSVPGADRCEMEGAGLA